MNLRLFPLALLALSAAASAAEPDLEALARETEAACLATAKNKITPEIIVGKVREAAALLEKEGPAAFDKFRGKDSKFVFSGTYLSVYDANAVVRFQPIKYQLVGKPIADLRDKNGKTFMISIMTVTKDRGEGWVDYWWPKPGEKEPSYKVSYAKRVKHGDLVLVVAAGTNDLTEAEGAKLVAAK